MQSLTNTKRYGINSEILSAWASWLNILGFLFSCLHVRDARRTSLMVALIEYYFLSSKTKLPSAQNEFNYYYLFIDWISLEFVNGQLECTFFALVIHQPHPQNSNCQLVKVCRPQRARHIFVSTFECKTSDFEAESRSAIRRSSSKCYSTLCIQRTWICSSILRYLFFTFVNPA